MSDFTYNKSSQDHDIHAALKTSLEISNSQTLLNWISDLEKHYGLQQKWAEFIKNDKKFRKFASNIVIATERDYNVEELREIAEEPLNKDTDSFDDFIRKCILSLLESGKASDKQKLQ